MLLSENDKVNLIKSLFFATTQRPSSKQFFMQRSLAICVSYFILFLTLLTNMKALTVQLFHVPSSEKSAICNSAKSYGNLQQISGFAFLLPRNLMKDKNVVICNLVLWWRAETYCGIVLDAMKSLIKIFAQIFGVFEVLQVGVQTP